MLWSVSGVVGMHWGKGCKLVQQRQYASTAAVLRRCGVGVTSSILIESGESAIFSHTE